MERFELGHREIKSSNYRQLYCSLQEADNRNSLTAYYEEMNDGLNRIPEIDKLGSSQKKKKIYRTD